MKNRIRKRIKEFELTLPIIVLLLMLLHGIFLIKILSYSNNFTVSILTLIVSLIFEIYLLNLMFIKDVSESSILRVSKKYIVILVIVLIIVGILLTSFYKISGII